MILDVDSIGAGGEGVGRLADGRVAFVHRTAPGDRVDVEPLAEKKRWVRGRVVSLLERSVDRVEPPCPHYDGDGCGGCQLMHVSYDRQLAEKSRIVGENLRRLGGADVPDPEVVAAENTEDYRYRVSWDYRGGNLGFHRLNDPAITVPVPQCRVVTRGIRSLYAWLLECKPLLPDGLRNVRVREDVTGDMHVLLDYAGSWDSRKFVSASLNRISSVWEIRNSRPRFFAGKRKRSSLWSFAQGSPEMAARIRRTAVDFLNPDAGQVVWDLFCGSGETACLLSEREVRVLGVDSDEAAIAECRDLGLPGASFRCAAAETVIDTLEQPDHVIVNPPRVGLADSLREYLARWLAQGRRLAYVSCDPATLARDLRAIGGRVAFLEAFDQFPHTSHVEVLAGVEAQ